MSLGGFRASFVLCATALFCAGVASGASILTPYNVIVGSTGTVTGTDFSDTCCDSGGGLAIEGAASIPGSWTIAGTLNGEAITSFPGSATLVVNGGIASGSANLDAGNWYVASGSVAGGGSALTSTPITDAQFATDFTNFGTLATNLNQTQTSGDSVVLSGNQLTITVAHTGANYVTVTAAQLAAGYGIYFDTSGSATFASSTAAGNAWVIVDVAGTSVTFDPGWGTFYNNTQYSDSDAFFAEDVLYDFYQATTADVGFGGVGNASTAGSVLAPLAAVTDTSGQAFEGSLVARSFTGSTEFHNYVFQGGATPEPAPMIFVGAGLVALSLVRQRRKA